MSANQSLAAMFQAIQGGQDAAPTGTPNPLEQMMNPPQMPPPEVPGQVPQPGNIPGAPGDPLQAQITQLQQQLAQNITELQKPIQSQIPPELADFDKYNEAKYQQAYGGGGVLGTAGRAVANLLSGFVNKGKTIKDTLTEQNRKDWQVAVQAEQQRIQLQKSQLAQATSAQAEQLKSLQLQQQMQNQAAQQTIAQTKVGLEAQSTPEAKAATEQKRRQDIVDKFKQAGNPLDPKTEQEFMATGKFPTDTDKFVPGYSSGAAILNVHPDAEISGKALDPKQYYRVNEKGEYYPTTPGQTITSVVNGQTITYRVGPDGQLEQVVTPTVRTKQAVPPGGPVPVVPPGPTTSGGGSPNTPKVTPLNGLSSLSPKDTLEQNNKIMVYDSAKKSIGDIKSNLGLLGDTGEVEKLVNAAKANKGVISGLVERQLGLTDNEVALVNGIRFLTEQANLLREPVGAMGFRSQNAYQNLTALAGQLRDDPKLTAATISKTEAMIDGLKFNAQKSVGKTPKVKVLKIEDVK